MSPKKPVIVYAASGYTGRLTCLQLTRLGVPFVAAGRHQGRLDAVANECRAQGADCVAEVCEHTPAGLQKLLRGSKVVINTSGPFSLLGRAVVQASLEEKVHYLDSTGEQDFMLEIRKDFGGAFERAKLVLSPSASFLFAPGCALAEMLLDIPGIDSIKVIYAPSPLQTVASLQSMLRTARRAQHRIVNRELVVGDSMKVRYVVVPGTQELRGSLLTGGAEATFLMGDKRVRNCETIFASDGLAASVGFNKMFLNLQRVLKQPRTDKITDALVLRFMKDPPEETPETTRFVVTALGEGNGVRAQFILHGAASYVVTGFLGAIGAKRILDGDAKRFGYVSLAQTFGARSVITNLEDVRVKLVSETPAAAQSVERALPSAAAYQAHSA